MEVGAQATSAAPDMADSGERAPTETGAVAASPLLLVWYMARRGLAHRFGK